MSDYLSNLAGRSLNLIEVVKPRLPSIFEPLRPPSRGQLFGQTLGVPRSDGIMDLEGSLYPRGHAGLQQGERISIPTPSSSTPTVPGNHDEPQKGKKISKQLAPSSSTPAVPDNRDGLQQVKKIFTGNPPPVTKTVNSIVPDNLNRSSTVVSDKRPLPKQRTSQPAKPSYLKSQELDIHEKGDGVVIQDATASNNPFIPKKNARAEDRSEMRSEVTPISAKKFNTPSRAAEAEVGDERHHFSLERIVTEETSLNKNHNNGTYIEQNGISESDRRIKDKIPNNSKAAVLRRLNSVPNHEIATGLPVENLIFSDSPPEMRPASAKMLPIQELVKQPHSARQRTERTETAQSLMSTEPEPFVQVTVGRIEVRANIPISEARSSSSSRPASTVMSLKEYLRQRNEGGFI